MMTKERFIKLMKDTQKWDRYCTKLLDVGFDPTFCDDYVGKLFDQLLAETFTTEGIDWIYWWLYEDCEKKIYDPINDCVSANVEDVNDFADYLYEFYLINHESKGN